jgi:hypothetical protein
LIVLDLFAKILNNVRKNGDESLQKSLQKTKGVSHFYHPVRVKAFLASAEARYVQYLDFIAKETGEDPLPLPPWLVVSHVIVVNTNCKGTLQ